jgi:lanosterol synthase
MIELAWIAWLVKVTVLYLLLVGPIAAVSHYLIVLCEWAQRRIWLKSQQRWPYQTTPHVRPTLVAPPPSDHKHWHLECVDGRQRWFYDPHWTGPVTFVERYHLGLTPQQPVAPRSTASEALRDGADFLMRLQDPDGHWPNDYSGPMFLLPGAIIVKFIVYGGDQARMFKCPQQRTEFIRYLLNMQNPDGGWGVHTESHSNMFGTTLTYVTLRLLGADVSHPAAVRARQWILTRGGAQSVPSWGKVWLSIAGVYDWEGVSPLFPELILLPDWVPFSTGKLWCHSRIVSTPFSYLYGLRFSPKPHPVITALRTELYTVPYESIRWSRHRFDVFEPDVYTTHAVAYRIAMTVAQFYEDIHLKSLRRRALDEAWKHIKYDDITTDYICLGPVNKELHMLITWLREGPDSHSFRRHEERLEDYFYIGPDGMRMSGYNGSQLWDTSFAVQAIVAAKLHSSYPRELAAAHHYVDIAQVVQDPPCGDRFYRHRTKGAWNFSTRAQSWQVSDCTAEGLRVVLLLRHNPEITGAPFPEERIFDAVDEILSLRVPGEGWASYEPPRTSSYVELINCAEVFKDIMIDYQYPECSSSCVHTLILFRRQFPDYRPRDVATAINEGIRRVKKFQRPDGSFYGSWGVCFTYAGWLVADMLQLAGEPAEGDTLTRLARFFIEKQNADGGWGEDFNACPRQVWVDCPDGSQVVNTAWALMALIAASGQQKRYGDSIHRAAKLLMARQLASGDWAQERLSGVFNGNAAIHYPGYKNVMPVWALAKYVSWCHR